MAGNAALLKHASNAPAARWPSSGVLARPASPPGLFPTCSWPAGRPAVTRRLIDDPRIAAVTLTGSEPAGRAVGAAAGERIKKTVLELGGSDPFIVLADADLRAPPRWPRGARLINAGQSCIAAKRFIVDAVRRRGVQAAVVARGAARLGDPEARRHRRRPAGAARTCATASHRQVERSVAAGARLLRGGAPRRGRALLPADRAGRRRARQAAYDEELFGPVAAIIVADGDEEAVGVANDTRFGLGASVWTGDLERGERRPADPLGRRVRQRLRRSDPACPSAASSERLRPRAGRRRASGSSSTSAHGGCLTSRPTPRRSRSSKPGRPRPRRATNRWPAGYRGRTPGHPGSPAPHRPAPPRRTDGSRRRG